ncbi:hypothetical protein QBC39DRAFT_366145 [Podospora conica]|nr:hypothetical protein QBC39DRAFT_366145 [Schizothecium conicum]
MGVDLESGPRTPPTPGTAPNGPAAFPDVAPDQPPGLQLPDDDPIQPGVEVQDGETQAQNDKDGIKPLKHRSQRQGSRFDRATDTVAGIGGEVKKEKGNETKMERYAVPPAFWSPLHVVSVLSFAMTVAIFIVAGYWEDGTAMLAIFFLSAASSVTCWASWWRPLLMNRPDNRVPKGDVVIRTRAGAFVLIKCREEVVRELYSGTEECKYVVGDNYYRILMGLGMVLLMVAVVLLGNCGWNSQALIGASYIILNAVYWGLGLLPSSYFWDLDRYTMKDITPKDAVDAHIVPKLAIKDVERLPSFTRTLWYAIRETEKVAWVERSGAMPMTDAWKKWLDEASAAAREARSAVREGKDVPKWPAVGRKNKILQEAEAEDADKTMKTTTSWSTAGTSSVTHRRPYEAAREVAPAETVQPSRAEPSSGTF